MSDNIFNDAIEAAAKVYNLTGNPDSAAMTLRDCLTKDQEVEITNQRTAALDDAFGYDKKGGVKLPSMTVRRHGFDINPTEPEAEALLTLREWTRAQTNPYLRARLQAWGELQHAIKLLDAGDEKACIDFIEGYSKKQKQTVRRLHAMLESLTYLLMPSPAFKEEGETFNG